MKLPSEAMLTVASNHTLNLSMVLNAWRTSSYAFFFLRMSAGVMPGKNSWSSSRARVTLTN